MNENLIVALEEEGLVTATFRRLSPAKKENLYRSAVEAFGSNVFDRVSLDKLADSAGISKGSLFQYFSNKENLLFFTGRVFVDDYKQYWQEYFNGERAVRVQDRIKSFYVAYVDFLSERKHERDFYFKMRFETSGDFSNLFITAIKENQAEYISRIINRGVETGELRGDLNSEYIIDLAQFAFDGTVLKLMDNSNKTTEIYIEKILKALFEGIRR